MFTDVSPSRGKGTNLLNVIVCPVREQKLFIYLDLCLQSVLDLIESQHGPIFPSPYLSRGISSFYVITKFFILIWDAFK